MNVGTFFTPITIEKRVVTQEPVYGTQVVSWVPLVTEGSPPVAVIDWAEVSEVLLLPRFGEVVAQGVSLARMQVKCRIRWRSDVTSNMRITIHGPSDVLYQITTGPAEVMAEGRQKVLEMILDKFTTEGTSV